MVLNSVFQGPGVSFILTISKKFINTETIQYEKSAASKDELSDEVEIVEVARGQTSTTPATGQVYQKNYRDPFVLDISQILMESRQKSKTSRDLEESHTDKEMASAHFPKSSFEHTRTITSRINKNSLNLFANNPGDFWLYSSDLWVFKGDFMA
ncbi:unnamed protein product [Rhizophagus irregularis]|nr:unnamed protein product [Rhizophagus irregularis]